MSKLLFAILDGNQLSVTYVNEAGDTCVASIDVSPEAQALREKLVQAVGVSPIKGFQIYGLVETPAAEEGGDPTVHGQAIEVLHVDGTNAAIAEPSEELAAARDALRLQLAAVID